MHPRRLWIVLGALAFAAAQAAVIYKWKDADGVWHYSDQAVPGAEKMETAGTSTYSGTGSVRGLQQNAKPAPAPVKPAGAGAFSQLSITSPTPEQSFFGAEPINVSLETTPALSSDHVVVWTLNGAPLTEQSPNATHFTLQSLSRGTYSLSAMVTDSSTGASQSAGTVTFYVRQPSELSPQHRSR